ncbi:MAG: hypothetical protein KDD46_01280 [Bdellovibrionales bacterium]|nr:hypothetical protein [Bdellovibrionales bacterium]
MNTKTFIVTLLLPLLVFARDTEALFLKKLHTFITKQESVEYAHKQIQDLKSPFRIDAVEFLREIKDVHSIPFLQKFMRDKDLNTFVIYALGELQAYEVTQDLID